MRILQQLRKVLVGAVAALIALAPISSSAGYDVENEYYIDNIQSAPICTADLHRIYYCGTCYIFFCNCVPGSEQERTVDLGQITGSTTSSSTSGQVCAGTQSEAQAQLPVSGGGVIIDVTGTVETYGSFCITYTSTTYSPCDFDY